MKVRTGALTAAAALALTFGVAGPASAAPAQRENAASSSVNATFVKTEAITCSDGSAGKRTFTTSYSGGVFRASGGKGDSAWEVQTDTDNLDVVVHDSCGSEDIVFWGGTAFYEHVPLFPLNAKSVDVNAGYLELFSWAMPENYPEGSAFLHFEANSKPVKTKEKDREVTVDGKTFTRSRSTQRGADVSGSITLTNTGIDYLDGRNLIEGATLIEASFEAATYKMKTKVAG